MLLTMMKQGQYRYRVMVQSRESCGACARSELCRELDIVVGKGMGENVG